MAYNPIVNVNISVNATPLTQQGFGTPLFITAHRAMKDRVVEISSATELLTLGTGFTTSSAAYKAAARVFSQTPKVPTMKIGRRDMNAVITPAAPTEDATTNYSFSITPIINNNEFPSTVTVSVTDVGGNRTAEDAVDAFITEFNSANHDEANDVITAQKVGSGTSATLLLQSTDSGDNSTYFTIGSPTNVTSAYNAIETPANTIAAISAVDTDWYFVGVEERSNADYVVSTAQALSGTGRPYLMFYASSDITNLSTYAAGNTDLFARLRDGNFDDVVTLFHQDASDYVEMAYIAANAPYDAGSVTWANLQIQNVGFSQDPSRGRPLTTSQKSALENKNANYIEYDAGVPFTRNGKTAGGEWIDVVRGTDWQTADLGTSLRNLLLGQRGSKINYTDGGINQVREAIMSSLQRGVNRQFLTEFTVTVPALSATATNDRLSRILNGVSFRATLAGAIHEVNLQGSVSV